jgi:hypothetical protein
MVKRMDDLFSESAPPLRLETTFAGPQRERRGGPTIVPAWGWVSRTRAAATVVFFGGAAWWYLLPAWQVAVFPAAAVACQCLRRRHGVRWAAWSVTLAAFGASALVPVTWPLRFVAILALVAPFVCFFGSQLRDV